MGDNGSLLLYHWGQDFARSAPHCEEVNQHRRMFFDGIVE